jgi:hypothetical protein
MQDRENDRQDGCKLRHANETVRPITSRHASATESSGRECRDGGKLTFRDLFDFRLCERGEVRRVGADNPFERLRMLDASVLNLDGVLGPSLSISDQYH